MVHGLLFLAVEQLITYRLKHGFRIAPQNDWHDLENHNSDILFIGSSKVWVEIDPFKVSRKFGVKAETIAQDGQTIDVLWQKFKQYSKVNRKPREIYIQCDPYFTGTSRDLFGFENFKSYFYNDRYNMGVLKNKTGYENYYKHLPLLAVGNQCIRFILNIQTSETYKKTRGYEPQNLQWIGDWNHPPPNIRFTLSGLNYLDSFHSFCDKNDIKCYFINFPVSPPSYSVISSYKMFYDSLKAKHIQLLNFNNPVIYNDSTLFYNHMHLNEKGANVFMNQFMNDTSVFKTYRYK